MASIQAPPPQGRMLDRSPAGDLNEALRASSLLWNFINQPNAATVICDSTGSIVWSSPSTVTALGFEASFLSGRNILSLIDTARRDTLAGLIAGEPPEVGDDFCAAFRTQDNSALWCSVEVTELQPGSPGLVLVCLRDSTRRIAGMRSLQQSEERFRTIVNQAPFGIGLQDKDGNFVFLNARMKKILGINSGYLLRDEVAEYIHPDDEAKITSAIAPGAPDTAISSEIRFIRPTGEVRWCSGTVIPQRDHRGTITNYLWAVEDTTARVRAEQDQARLYTLMETSSDLVMVLDEALRPQYLNPAARGFLGLDLTAKLSSNAPALELQTLPVNAMTTIIEQMGRGEIWQGELTILAIDGEWRPFSAMVVPDLRSNGEVNQISAVLRDIRERKDFEKRLEWEATHDPLTELPNRLMLMQRLSSALERSARTGSWVAVAFLDLDNFRIINESLGHRVGDSLLRQTAEKLDSLVWSRDMAARFGADEFAILMENLETPEEAEALTERIRKSLSGRVGMSEVELLMTFSAGVAASDGVRCDAASLVRDANAALHEAKEKGRDRTAVFNGQMRARAVDRLSIETGLRRALRRDELRLYYQPQVDLQTGKINGAEALIRWQHPDHGVLGPGDFIPIAEKSGLIIPIGSWVMLEACRQLARWSVELPNGRDFTMGVNLSGRQLIQPKLIEEISTIIETTGIDPAKIEVEITESILLDDVDRSIHLLERMKAMGLKLALDDFGTGYSSLTYLRSFPIDVVKIDRSFVEGIGTDPDSAAIVRSIVDLSRTLGLRTIAEGVETDEELTVLRNLGCDVAQGYLISKPLAAIDAARLISYNPTW